MEREVISTCPVCESQLTVTRLHCNTCGTTIEGGFSVGRFARLSRDQYALLESFLRARGNLRELERELGVSYPTVRNRVEALLRALDLGDGTPIADEPTGAAGGQAGHATVDPETRRAILERLARHELSAEQAAVELRGEPVVVVSPAEQVADAAAGTEPREEAKQDAGETGASRDQQKVGRAADDETTEWQPEGN